MNHSGKRRLAFCGIFIGAIFTAIADSESTVQAADSTNKEQQEIDLRQDERTPAKIEQPNAADKKHAERPAGDAKQSSDTDQVHYRKLTKEGSQRCERNVDNVKDLELIQELENLIK